ncbi:MAG: hypothetical protein ACRDL7_07860, partial [Gaiellaceae bacterium]
MNHTASIKDWVVESAPHQLPNKILILKFGNISSFHFLDHRAPRICDVKMACTLWKAPIHLCRGLYNFFSTNCKCLDALVVAVGLYGTIVSLITTGIVQFTLVIRDEGRKGSHKQESLLGSPASKWILGNIAFM